MLEFLIKYLHISPICDITGVPKAPKGSNPLITQQENGIICCKLFISFCFIFTSCLTSNLRCSRLLSLNKPDR